MSYTTVVPAGMTTVGYQRTALSGTAVYTLNSTCDGAEFVWMSVETANVRVRWDGTAPTATTGVLVVAGGYVPVPIDLSAPASFKFTAASGSPVVNLQAFRYTANQPK